MFALFPTTTLRIYTQVMQHSRRGVAERLDQAIWGDSRSQTGRKTAESEPISATAGDRFGSRMHPERA